MGSLSQRWTGLSSPPAHHQGTVSLAAVSRAPGERRTPTNASAPSSNAVGRVNGSEPTSAFRSVATRGCASSQVGRWSTTCTAIGCHVYPTAHLKDAHHDDADRLIGRQPELLMHPSTGIDRHGPQRWIDRFEQFRPIGPAAILPLCVAMSNGVEVARIAELTAHGDRHAWRRERAVDLKRGLNVGHEAQLQPMPPVCRSEGVGLKVLTGQGAAIHTTTPAGKLIFGIFAALAEFEWELIAERTRAGLAAARARRGGAPYKMTPTNVRLAMAAMGQPETHIGALCRELGVTRQTLDRHVSPNGALRPDGKRLLDGKQSIPG